MNPKEEIGLDNLGGHGGMLPAEVLKMLNELLERMHWAGHNNQGSKIEIVYVAPGGQHVDSIQTQNVYTFKQQEPEGQKKRVTPEQLARAIEQCQKYFWGNSAYAVLFCLLRDEYDMPDNQTQFETMVEQLPYSHPRDYTCPPGTISSAFSNTPLYRIHVSRWDTQKPLPRVLTLLSELRKAVKFQK